MNKLFFLLVSLIGFNYLSCDNEKENIKDLSSKKVKNNNQLVVQFEKPKIEYPFSSIDLNNITSYYSEINCKIEGVEEFLCGYPNLRYRSVSVNDDLNIIIVPMDCGDYILHHLLTIYKNKVVDNIEIDGVWHEPESDDNDEVKTSFVMENSSDLNIYREFYVGEYKRYDSASYYKVESDGKITNKYNGINWEGMYSLVAKLTRDERVDSVQYLFNVMKDKISVSYYEENSKVYESEFEYDLYNDSLVVRTYKDPGEIDNEFIIQEGDETFYVHGQSVYMINPPNPEYSLDKIE